MPRHSWRDRGRPRNHMFSYKDRRILESLARIAVENKVNPNEFSDRIVYAWNHEGSECGHLAIRCRQRTRDSAIFLFTKGQGRDVIVQFPISIAMLREKNQLGSFMETVLAQTSSVNLRSATTSKIRDLRIGMKKVSIEAEVLEIPETRTICTRYGTMACVSNALIGDETGSMKMSLWNQQIGMVHKGDRVTVKNGQVSSFSGEKQLRVGRSGTLSVMECAAADVHAR